MKISVVVPVYNVEKYVYECLESIKNQTHSDFECILVDDGSTDSSGDICDSFASSDERFRVLHKANGGLVSARKHGVSAASSEYVCFVDSDDYIGGSFLSDFNAVIESHRPDMIANNYITPFGGASNDPFFAKKYLGSYENDSLDELKEAILYDKSSPGMNFGAILPSLCLKCIRRELLNDQYSNCDENISMGEDAMITFPLALECKSIYVISTEGYFYRKNYSSIVNTFKPSRFDEIFKLRSYFEKKIPSHSLQAEYYFLSRIYDSVISAAMSMTDKGAFISLVNAKLSVEETHSYGRLNTKAFSLKSKAVLFFIRKRYWSALYLIIKLFS